MYHEDQIEFYSCPLCGVGTGNDLEETQTFIRGLLSN